MSRSRIFCVVLYCMTVCAFAMPENPLTSEQAGMVMARLDLSYPGLEEAGKALQRGDLRSAQHLVAAYFRKKTADVQLPPRKLRTDLADRIVQGYMKEVQIPHHFPDGNIHWGFNPTKEQGRSYDPEWLWQLNRMSFWRELGYAYFVTRDEKYARTFSHHLRSWAAYWKKPEGNGNAYHSAWRTIECGIRLGGSWPYAFSAMASSGEFTDQDILLYLYCSLLQADHLRKYPKTGNWLTMEMNGLYTFAATHPEFRESAGWRKFAMERLSADLKKQILPDGAQYELSPGYHFVALSNSLALLKQAEAAGFGGEIPAGFREVLQRGYHYLVRLMTPDRNFPKTNDSWSNSMDRSFRGLGQLFPEDPLIAFGANGAKEKDAPSFTSCFFPYAGFAVFRRNWKTDGHYLLFDVGPLGRAHVHQDKLNIILYGYGEELLFDDGGGNYERSKYRDYALSSAGHSLVLVDGEGQNRKAKGENQVVTKPIDARFRTGPDADYAEGTISDFSGKAAGTEHRRQVWYIKPDLFLVCDTLSPADLSVHRYQARWQVDALHMKEVFPGAWQSDRRKKADILIVPLDGKNVKTYWVSNANELPEMGGLYVGRDPRPYRPAVTLIHERSGKGRQRFLTLLCPVRAGAKNLIQKVERHPAGVERIFFTDGRILVVTVPQDKAQNIRWAWENSLPPCP